MPKDNPQELFVVVDENDTVIGYKTRYECHRNKLLIHRAVGIVIYNDRGEVLVQKRSKQKDMYPGFYTLSASGHVGKGESYGQAAVRELKEELGIRADLTHIKTTLLKTPGETEMDTLFTARHNGPFIPDENEIETIIFFSPYQIRKMQSKFTPHAIESLKILKILF